MSRISFVMLVLYPELETIVILPIPVLVSPASPASSVLFWRCIPIHILAGILVMAKALQVLSCLFGRHQVFFFLSSLFH